MALVLLQQLIVFLILIMIGFFLVKSKAAKTEDSHLLSVISIYILLPCIIVKAFQVHMTKEIFQGMLLAVLVSIAIHLLFWVIIVIGQKVDGWDAVEKASIMYPNCGNLILPIIPVLFGEEWVIYASAYMCVQMAFFWTHCVSLFNKKNKFSIWTLLKMPNIIAMFVGVIVCMLPFELPEIITSVISNLSAMFAPAAMLTIGMALAALDMKAVLKNPRTYRLVLIRLIFCPLLVLLLMKVTGVGSLVENGNTILLITMLGCMAPPAATITQIAQVYDGDAAYASSINTLSLVACVVTMPLIVAVYEALIH